MILSSIKRCCLAAYFAFLIMLVFFSYEPLVHASFGTYKFPWLSVGVDCIATDFVNTYNCALLSQAARHQLIDIYDIRTQDRSMRSILAPQPYPLEKPFYTYYPPTFFALVTPLAGLKLSEAWAFWWASGLALSLLSITALLSMLELSICEQAFVLVAFVASYPTVLAARIGQPAFLLLPALTFVIFAVVRQKHFTAGLLTGLLLFKIQHTPQIVAAGIGMGRRRYFLGFLCSFACAIFGCAAWLGWHNVLNYPRGLALETSPLIEGVQPMMMQDFRGQMFMFTGQSHEVVGVQIAAVVLYIVSLACTARLAAFAISSKNRSVLLFSISTIVLLMLISSLHTGQYDFMLAVIPAIFLFHLCKQNRAHKTIHILELVLLMYPLYSWLGASRSAVAMQPQKASLAILFYTQPVLSALGIWDAIYPFMLRSIRANEWWNPFVLLPRLQPDFWWAVSILILSSLAYKDLCLLNTDAPKPEQTQSS